MLPLGRRRRAGRDVIEAIARARLPLAQGEGRHLARLRHRALPAGPRALRRRRVPGRRFQRRLDRASTRMTAIAGLAELRARRSSSSPSPPRRPRGDGRRVGRSASRSSPTSRSTRSTTSSRSSGASAADALNVYVGKAGGMEKAVRQMRTAAAFGIPSILGSNGEMGLGAAAQVHVACAVESLAPFPSDIIGHHYYDEDILETPLGHRRRRGATARRARPRRAAVGGDQPPVLVSDPVVGCSAHDRRRPHAYAQPPRRGAGRGAVVNTAWRPDRPVVASTTWADHDAAQREGGVDVSLVFNIATRTVGGAGVVVDLARVNDSTAEFVRGRPGPAHRLLLGRPGAPGRHGRARALRRRPGPAGHQARAPTTRTSSRSANPPSASTDRPRQHGMPILFHQGTSPIRTAPLRYAHPMVMDEIAIAFPDLRVVMAHLGPSLAGRHDRGHPQAPPRLRGRISAGFYRPWSFYQAMRLATEWGVLPKLLFGSDFPVATARETIDGTRARERRPCRHQRPAARARWTPSRTSSSVTRSRSWGWSGRAP